MMVLGAWQGFNGVIKVIIIMLWMRVISVHVSLFTSFL